MVNQTLLTAIRRLRTQAWCETTYETVLAAFTSRLEKVTIITSKSSETDSATGQIVIQSADYDMWMATLEARLAEYEAVAAGETATHTGSEAPDFSRRYLIP